jgi:DNA repair photolyase
MHRTREAFRAVQARAIKWLRLYEDVCALALLGLRAAPVHLCFSCDPFPVGQDYGHVLSAIRLLGESGQAMQILTKNPRGALRVARREIEKYRIAFGVSLVWDDDAPRREYEPGAPSVDERIGALCDAKAAGIRTWVSLEPVIDPAAALNLIRMLHRAVDVWKIGKIEHSAELGAGVDWGQFRRDVELLAGELRADVYLKESLRLAV